MKRRIPLDRLLEAEPAELRGEADTEVGEAIRTDEDSRAVADVILEGEARLSEGVNALVPATVEAALAAVRRDRNDRRHRRQVRARVGWLAAAAAVAVLIVGRPWNRIDDFPTAPTPASTRPDVQVRLPPQTNAMVLKTDNPQITVLWFY